MNQSTLLGLGGGLALVIGMMLMSPEHMGAFLNFPGLIVVLGGTLMATFISRPIKDVYAVLRGLPDLFRDTPSSLNHDINQLLHFARRYRSHAINLAERELLNMHNVFLKRSLRLVLDNEPLDDLLKSMHWRISGIHNAEQSKVQILYTMATFAPAFGMLGTLFGLVHMLSGLGNSGLSEIGGTMAFAMITTVYGIILSNLFFKPLAIKMERQINHQVMQLNVLMEGIVQVHQRRHPTQISETLEAYYSHHHAVLEPRNMLTLVKES